MTQLKFKRNVTVIFNTWVEHMIGAGLNIWNFFNEKTFVVTSGIEGRHSPTSSHYEGRAIDVRLPSKKNRQQIAKKYQKTLGRKYFVLLENDHIHVQVKRGVRP